MSTGENGGHYRPCVGIMLLNAEGLVFIGRRRVRRGTDAIGAAHLWQMPQGGIDAGEEPYEAALRELAEETSIRSVEKIAEAPDWYCYDLPVDASRRSWRGRYQGQRQRWFALRHVGPESEINVAAPAGGFKPEFEAWRWAPMAELPALVIPFKRPVYEKVVAVFSSLAKP